MRMIDLFSGIGGFHLAAEWTWGADLEVVAHCELDPTCQKRLKKHWPDVPVYDDVKTFKGDCFDPVDILTGGDPCQPYSIAGQQGGEDDDRYLWPEVLRIIKEAKPTWYLGENVVGLTRMGIEKRIADLETQGYEVQTLNIPACAVYAPHRRERVWIIAHSESESIGAGLREDEQGGKRRRRSGDGDCKRDAPDPDEQHADDRRSRTGEICGRRSAPADVSGSEQVTPDSTGLGSQGKRPSGFKESGVHGEKVLPVRDGSYRREWPAEPDVGRVGHGIPHRVDRLRGLGNAIVPQIAEVIFRCIKQIQESEA